MKKVLGRGAAAFWLLSTCVAVAAPSPLATPTRAPRGIYSVVAADEEGGLSTAELNAIAENPAVTGGLAIRVFWSTLQPARDHYDFSRLEEAFAVAAAHHKTVQLILLPGFGTPDWLMSTLPSCDPYLSGESPGPGTATCGKAIFDFSEGFFHGPRDWPLPWNAEYKKCWRTLLSEVAVRFGARREFVSIAIAGPTVASAEMIVPHKLEQLDRWTRLLKLFYRDPSYHQSNRAIVEEWEDAIESYGQIFRGVTLVLTHGSGLLRFSSGSAIEAEASIVSYFTSHSAGANFKATQTSGMRACRPDGEGLRSVKQVALETSGSSRILGGAQFDTSFSRAPRGEGCPSSCDNSAPDCEGILPWQALSNVLSVFFAGTAVGDLHGGAKGAVPLSYLQVYARDILFANAHPRVQALLEQASQHLAAIAP